MPLIINNRILDEEAQQTMISIELLAKQVYKSSIVISSEQLLQWYRRNPFIWILARLNDHIIGYMSVIPLKLKAFSKTLKIEYDEIRDIDEDDIRNWNDQSNEPYSLYICSIVVHPQYQKRSDFPVFYLMMKKFLETVLFYSERQIVIEQWSACAVTQAGCHILENYFGMKCIVDDNHQHKIYYGKTNILLFRELLQKLETKLKPYFRLIKASSAL